MSPEAQNKAIAEACGWNHRLATVDNPVVKNGMRLPNFFGPSVEAWWNDSLSGGAERSGVYASPPRYTTDLNAMREALMAQPQRVQVRYIGNLYCIVDTDGGNESKLADDWKIHTATAAQCAEALLNALNLWVEE